MQRKPPPESGDLLVGRIAGREAGALSVRVLTLGVPIKFWAGIIKWTRPAAPYLHGRSLEETS